MTDRDDQTPGHDDEDPREVLDRFANEPDPEGDRPDHDGEGPIPDVALDAEYPGAESPSPADDPLYVAESEDGEEGGPEPEANTEPTSQGAGKDSAKGKPNTKKRARIALIVLLGLAGANYFGAFDSLRSLVLGEQTGPEVPELEPYDGPSQITAEPNDEQEGADEAASDSPAPAPQQPEDDLPAPGVGTSSSLTMGPNDPFSVSENLAQTNETTESEAGEPVATSQADNSAVTDAEGAEGEDNTLEVGEADAQRTRNRAIVRRLEETNEVIAGLSRRIAELESLAAQIATLQATVGAMEESVGSLERTSQALRTRIEKGSYVGNIDVDPAGRPAVRVVAIMRDVHCTECPSHALVRYDGEELPLVSGDTFLDFEVEIEGHRLVLKRADERYTYFPRS